MLLRSLYSFLRILPAHQLYRRLSRTRDESGQSIVFRLVNSKGAPPIPDAAAFTNFRFPLTDVGESGQLGLGVVYRKDAAAESNTLGGVTLEGKATGVLATTPPGTGVGLGSPAVAIRSAPGVAATAVLGGGTIIQDHFNQQEGQPKQNRRWSEAELPRDTGLTGLGVMQGLGAGAGKGEGDHADGGGAGGRGARERSVSVAVPGARAIPGSAGNHRNGDVGGTNRASRGSLADFRSRARTLPMNIPQEFADVGNMGNMGTNFDNLDIMGTMDNIGSMNNMDDHGLGPQDQEWRPPNGANGTNVANVAKGSIGGIGGFVGGIGGFGLDRQSSRSLEDKEDTMGMAGPPIQRQFPHSFDGLPGEALRQAYEGGGLSRSGTGATAGVGGYSGGGAFAVGRRRLDRGIHRPLRQGLPPFTGRHHYTHVDRLLVMGCLVRCLVDPLGAPGHHW